MRILFALIAFFCLTPLWADEAILKVKCPENWRIVIGNTTRQSTGTERAYSFELEKGETKKIHLFSYVDGNNLVIWSGDVEIIGGKTIDLDLRTDKDKTPEPKVPEPVKPKPSLSFDLFGKSALKKPDFGCISKSIDKKVKIESEKIKIEKITQSQPPINLSTANCST